MIETRERIVSAARDLYLEGGLAALSMRKVAKMADISATAIYRHFDSKEAMLTAVCADGYGLFGRYLARGLRGADPLDRLRQTGAGYLDFALDHPAYYRIMFMTNAAEHGFAEWIEAHQRQVLPTFQFLVDRVRECVDAGLLAEPAGGLRELAAWIWSHSHGMVSLWLLGQFDQDVPDPDGLRDFYQRSVNHLLRGLEAPT